MKSSVLPNKKFCRVRLAHMWSKRTQKYSARHGIDSFLFTFLRKPEKRDLSMYYFFFIDWKQLPEPDDQEVIAFLKQSHNSQLGEVIDKEPRQNIKQMTKRRHHKQLHALVQRTLEQFNFLGLVERMDESLVVLQLLYHLFLLVYN